MNQLLSNEPPSGDPLVALDGLELVFAFVGPVGCHLSAVQEILDEELKTLAYKTIDIRLSDLMRDLRGYEKLPVPGKSDEYERIDRLMDAGTELRTITKRGDIFSLLLVSKIREERLERHNLSRDASAEEQKEALFKPLNRTAFLVRSLKHPDEADTLRDIYGRAFFLMSIYSPEDVREKALTELIKRRAGFGVKRSKAKELSEKLIRKDENEDVAGGFGQRVRDTFHLADVFIDSRDKTTARTQIRRFLKTVFDAPDATPRKAEFCMNMAKAVSMRSADLSRQVGAVVVSDAGDLLAVGCNDVAKAHGGQYWVDDLDDKLDSDLADGRDYARGFDSATTFRLDLVSEFLERLATAGFVVKGEQDWDELAKNLLLGDKKVVLKDTMVASLIEHGRPVHAEMAALMDAARRGVSVSGSTLYCTTFPCHLCAKHIVASGVKHVVYVEPYPKSLAKDLYDDSVILDNVGASDKVVFRPFVGIAPRFFSRAFEKTGRRKNEDGTRREWIPKDANPKFKRFVLSYMLIEEDVIDLLLSPKLKAHNLI